MKGRRVTRICPVSYTLERQALEGTKVHCIHDVFMVCSALR